METGRMARCWLCEGSLPASDTQTMIRHMMEQHGAETENQAKEMAGVYFSEINETPEENHQSEPTAFLVFAVPSA